MIANEKYFLGVCTGLAPLWVRQVHPCGRHSPLLGTLSLNLSKPHSRVRGCPGLAMISGQDACEDPSPWFSPIPCAVILLSKGNQVPWGHCDFYKAIAVAESPVPKGNKNTAAERDSFPLWDSVARDQQTRMQLAGDFCLFLHSQQRILMGTDRGVSNCGHFSSLPL